MRTVICTAPLMAVTVVLALGFAVEAAAQPPAPPTIWSFLGIPKGIQKIRDGLANRRGNRPNWERKPPLKKLADPANLEAENPAIKAAAKIKTEEDLAGQKIKAIKYLATVGCAGCYPGVKEALMAALDDCSEEVRYEAAVAFCEASGSPCSHCNPDSCCAADAMTKLQEIAYEQDDQGCYKEASSRVRAAAASALGACRRVRPPAPAEPAPADDKEVPAEAPLPEPELKEIPAQAKRIPLRRQSAATPISLPKRTHSDGTAATRQLAPVVIKPAGRSSVSPTGYAQTSEGPPTADAGGLRSIACAVGCCSGCSSPTCRHRRGQGRRVVERRGRRIVEEPCPYIIEDGALIPDELAAADDLGALTPDEMGLGDQYAATPSGLASAPGAAFGPQSAIPNMIGDNFAGAGMSTITVQPPSYMIQDPSVTVNFGTLTMPTLSIYPAGGSPSNAGFDVDDFVEFNYPGNATVRGTPITAPSTFTSTQDIGAIGAQTPGPPPSSFALDTGNSQPYRDQVTQAFENQNDELRAQEAAYRAANGPGAFAYPAGEGTVNFNGGTATVLSLEPIIAGAGNGPAGDEGSVEGQTGDPPPGVGIEDTRQVSANDTYEVTQAHSFTTNAAAFTPDPYAYTPSTVAINTPRPGTSVVGRMKIAENSSPLPRDRVLFGYSFFENVAMFAGGVNVSRFTPGFEKTFFDGQMSFEMRTPMAVTLDSSFLADGGTDLSHGEFGNMGLTFKALLMRRPTWALAGGLTAVVPTADDINVSLADGTPLVQIRNESTHLQPYVGALWTPNDRFFAQGFMQWDVAANDNPVLVNQGSGLAYVDDVHDVTFQFLDVGVGYWSYRGQQRYRRLTGLAWTAELHWNRSLQSTDVVSAGNFRIGDYSSAIELFNLTLGVHVEFYQKSTLTLAYVTPLGGGADRQFDSELRVMFNRRFGPQSRATRTPL